MYVSHFDRGKAYLHGGESLPLPLAKKFRIKFSSKKLIRKISKWKARENDDITFANGWLSKLNMKAEKIS